MKKSLVIVLLGLAATSSTKSFGQGILTLQNYTITGAPYATYGLNVPTNGVSGAFGTPGSGLGPGFTAGFYWAPGNVTASVANDWTYNKELDPSTLGGGLVLATGTGSTAQFAAAAVFNTPGAFQATSAYTTAGVAAGGTITMEVTAYAGSSYASALYRSHTDAFLVTVANPTGYATPVGETMLPLSITIDPEPSLFSLASMSGVTLLLFRRRKPGLRFFQTSKA